MCEWGNTIDLLVPIPADESFSGTLRWDMKAIDRCLSPIIQALNDGGIHTAGCCCGHGKEDGKIVLHDKRVIVLPMKRYELSGDTVDYELTDIYPYRDINLMINRHGWLSIRYQALHSKWLWCIRKPLKIERL